MGDPMCKAKTGLTFLPALQTSWFLYSFRHSYIQNVFISTQSGLGTTLGVESDMASVFMELIDHVGASLVTEMVKNLPAVEETQVWPLGQEDPPGEGNGCPLQYSCLRIPWTEEPGGLQSMGSQRVEQTERLTLSLSFIDLCRSVSRWR